MATSDGAALEARSVHKEYGGKAVLRDISFAVARGEQVALIGPSGSGKTTLLRLFSAVLWPSAGQVLALGRDTAELRGHGLCELRKLVGFLHQSDNLIPGLRVAHNVLMGRLGSWSLLRALWSLFWPQEVEKAHSALQRVELGDRLWAMPGELSGGEQQRVAIARILLQEPEVILADEPVSSLDIRLGREVVRLLCALARDRGAALLVSLHTLELLDEGFDRVLALKDGRLIWSGRPDEVTRPLLREVYGTEYQALHLDELSLARGNGDAADRDRQ